MLAVDPGFKSGCKLAALDEFGNLLDHSVVHSPGRQGRAPRRGARQSCVELIKQHQLTLVAIGNGTACRETEEVMGELLAERAEGQGVAYVDRQRGRRQRLFHQPAGARRVSGI